MRRVSKPSSPGPVLLPRLRVIVGTEVALGPGKVELLEAIQDAGSILKAARKMQMSYMRAWTLLKTMEKCFKTELVSKSRGGRHGGSAHLTPTGRTVLGLYRRMERECLRATRANWREVRRHLKT
jgi:molybdate transport system regulatory protein